MGFIDIFIGLSITLMVTFLTFKLVNREKKFDKYLQHRINVLEFKRNLELNSPSCSLGTSSFLNDDYQCNGAGYMNFKRRESDNERIYYGSGFAPKLFSHQDFILEAPLQYFPEYELEVRAKCLTCQTRDLCEGSTGRKIMVEYRHRKRRLNYSTDPRTGKRNTANGGWKNLYATQFRCLGKP
jgi:hypothetical protein